jgi:hypothetical protein
MLSDRNVAIDPASRIPDRNRRVAKDLPPRLPEPTAT